MWNWLMECYNEKSLTQEEMEKVLVDDTAARELWDSWADDSYDFIDFVRKEVKPFLRYVKQREIDEG